MNRILKINQFDKINESFTKLSDEEIEDYFMSFVDDNKFKLTRGYVNTKGNMAWRFYSNISSVLGDTLNCVKIEINMSYKKGKIWGTDTETMSDFEGIEEAISEIKQFYKRVKQDPSFNITNKFGEIIISFYILGDKVSNNTLDKKEEIKNYLEKIKELYKQRTGWRNISLKSSNWLEIKIPKRGNDSYTEVGVRNYFRRLYDGVQIPTDNNGMALSDIFSEMREKGYDLKISGGDYQVVLSIK